MSVSTMKKRADAVAQANANAAIEGFAPDDEHLDMQERFVTGEIGVEEMLEEIRALAIADGAGATDTDVGSDQ